MITFKRFFKEAVLQPQQQYGQTPNRGGGTLQGPQSGGTGSNWGGSLPKLISILPPGNWFAGSQKRGKVNTKSGGVSDHYSGNATAYACDFGLNSTFKGNKNAATKFCIDVANNAGQNIQSWQPYVGNHLSFNTSDGYRIQIIWQSNVGGNHYDHVHLGVKAGRGAENINMPPTTDDTQGGGDATQVGSDAQTGGSTSGREEFLNPQAAVDAAMGAIGQLASYGKGRSI